ncbi:MAG: hypothetical protein K8U57_16910 [Planctomycetes bacterium]|nr:hypothetical protein [Planctomycetota bacterium]
MEQALRQFLARLEAIDEDHAGLGDTNVRELMGEDILRGFLRLEPDFIPSGEYGLGPEGNQRVTTTITRFVTAARTAAEREGINTFHARLAAFQNDGVRTVDGSNFNDFFGVKDGTWFDAAGNDLR